MPEPRILFILKKQHRQFYTAFSNGYDGYASSPGLKISTQFVVQMLQDHGYTTKLVQVNDNNDIDREVTDFQPTVVVIEALWVVPTKFTVLTERHPTVRWIVQVHSKLPFLMHEGMALTWLSQYLDYPNVDISFNSLETADTFANLYVIRGISPVGRVHFLPNYYPLKFSDHWVAPTDTLRVGCFGAIRPFKNQLTQAIAAVEYATLNGLGLEFHVNSSRIEQQADPVLKNVQALFASLPVDQYQLVEHPWMPHDLFLGLMQTMHLLMQVSFTETFNIVAADAVANGIPVVASDEIDWIAKQFQANPNDVDSIVEKMTAALVYRPFLQSIYDPNKAGLANASRRSVHQWKELLSA